MVGHGGPTRLLTEAEERQYFDLSQVMGWAPGYDDRMPHSRDIEAMEALRYRILGKAP